jgi:hypothetical protein
MASVAYRPQGDLAWAPSVALAYGPRLDMNYKYHVQYRDPDTQTEPMDKVLYDYYVDGDGTVNAFTVALGQEVTDDIYVGIGIDFLRGEYESGERYVYPVDSDETDSRKRWEFNDVSGTQFTIGLLVETMHRLDVAFVYRSAFDLDDFTYSYPDAFGIGFQYHPRNLIMTTLSFDVEYTRWSDFEVSEGYVVVEGPELEDTVVYRVGVEHGFYDDTQARFGFIYEPSYADNSIARSGFCAGIGMDVFGVRLDVGGRLMMREYDVGDARLQETTTQAMVTFLHTF